MIKGHSCPWPGCGKRVGEFWWGCIMHWAGLPWYMRQNWIRAKESKSSAAVRSVEAGIQEWIVENHGVSSTATPDLAAAFVSGVTDGGDMFLFWPPAGEYLVVPRKDIATIINGARLALQWKGRNG